MDGLVSGDDRMFRSEISEILSVAIMNEHILAPLMTDSNAVQKESCSFALMFPQIWF